MRRTPPAGNDRVTHSVLLARAREAPVRVAILEILSIDLGRTLSPVEIAFELQAGIEKVIYHVRILHLLGFVEVGGESLIGNTYERRFCLAAQLPADSTRPSV